MPFSPAQLVTGANYSLATYQRKTPIDQINVKHATLDWLIKNKEESNFGNGSFKEPVYYNNDSNYQNYFGADQVTYNERDPDKWTDFTWYNAHDGFWFDEDRLLAAGITLLDDTSAIPTAQEKESLIDLLKESYRSLRNSMQEGLALETLRDGTQSTKAVPGLANLVSTTPALGVIGGISAVTDTYWRNNINLGVAELDLVDQMEITWRACMTYGGILPDFIVVGAAFLDAYRRAAGLTINRRIENGGNERGGVSLDASTTKVYFKGVELVWDPTFEQLDALVGGTTNTKTALFLNSNVVKLRPVKRNWMVNRRPERLPDRYVHYFAKTSKYSLTINQRNATARMTIA